MHFVAARFIFTNGVLFFSFSLKNAELMSHEELRGKFLSKTFYQPSYYYILSFHSGSVRHKWINLHLSFFLRTQNMFVREIYIQCINIFLHQLYLEQRCIFPIHILISTSEIIKFFDENFLFSIRYATT